MDLKPTLLALGLAAMPMAQTVLAFDNDTSFEEFETGFAASILHIGKVPPVLPKLQIDECFQHNNLHRCRYSFGDKTTLLVEGRRDFDSVSHLTIVTTADTGNRGGIRFQHHVRVTIAAMYTIGVLPARSTDLGNAIITAVIRRDIQWTFVVGGYRVDFKNDPNQREVVFVTLD